MDINHWVQIQLTKQIKVNQSTGADVDLVLLVVDDFGIVFVTMYHVYCGLFVGSNSRYRWL